MTPPTSDPRSPLPPDWRDAIDAIGRAIVAGEEASVDAAVAAWLPRLDTRDPEQRTAIGRCRTWAGTLALRRGEHLAAIRAFADAVLRLDPETAPFQHVHARTQLAAAMSGLGLHAEGLSTAARAADFGLAHGLQREAAQALMVVGLCAVLLGDPGLAERYTRDALAIGLAEDSAPVVRFATINLVFIVTELAEQQRERGDLLQARQALWRAAGHVHRGDRLDFPAGSFEATLFLSNRTRWLALDGRADEAVATWTEVAGTARSRGWLEVERHATFGLGRLAADRGERGAAIAWLLRCVEAGSAHDAYRVVERAHARLAALFEASGERAAADRHREAADRERLAGEERLRRATVTLRDIDENLLVTLADFDRTHLDMALDRLHRTLPFPGGPRGA